MYDKKDGDPMTDYKGPMKSVTWLQTVVAGVIVFCLFIPPQAMAQLPARFYWKTLTYAKAAPLVYESLSGNTNPFDSAHTVTPDANFDATMAMACFAQTFSLFDRAAMGVLIMPMGRISGEVTVAGQTAKQSTRGFGDPMLEFDINVLGPQAQKGIDDIVRYEPGLSVDLLVDLALPIGEYDNDQPLNIGQNRWYGRVGMPVVWQLGPWVPGRRTTLEFLPAVWFFGDNDDYVGQTLETDPIFQLDAHLSRDFTEHFWGAIDATWYNGGKATIEGVEGEKINNIGLGLTLGYTINDNSNLTFGYMSTVNDDAPDDLRMDKFMITFVYGWHPIIEGMKRLESHD
jgi:hypothetical protein